MAEGCALKPPVFLWVMWSTKRSCERLPGEKRSEEVSCWCWCWCWCCCWSGNTRIIIVPENILKYSITSKVLFIKCPWSKSVLLLLSRPRGGSDPLHVFVSLSVCQQDHTETTEWIKPGPGRWICLGPELRPCSGGRITSHHIYMNMNELIIIWRSFHIIHVDVLIKDVFGFCPVWRFILCMLSVTSVLLRLRAWKNIKETGCP